MGQVFLAEDIRLGRHVALKSLAGKWLASASSRERLMREGRAVGVLAHSNIATLYDVLEDDARLLLVMEYVDGKTVKEMIDESPMPAGQALRVAAQVAAAIGYATRSRHDPLRSEAREHPGGIRRHREGARLRSRAREIRGDRRRGKSLTGTASCWARRDTFRPSGC